MAQITQLLPGASRGIGHATVKALQITGQQVLAVSRRAFDARCLWHAGSTDHFQGAVDDPSARAAFPFLAPASHVSCAPLDVNGGQHV